MRPIASTWVASMQNIEAPDSASVLMCVKCQSLASPFTAEYWHIGATMMRFGSARPRSFIGENRALMGGVRAGGRNSCLYLARRRAFLNPRKAALVMPGLVPGIHVLFHGSKKAVDGRVIEREDALRAFARP